MRTRTIKEREAMGLLDPIFRDLAIKKRTRGYLPLLDMMCYAYAYPEKKITDIIDYLSKENYYVGVREEDEYFTLVPSMKRSIETAVEGTEISVLKKYGLEKLSIIVKGTASEQPELEKKFLLAIGEQDYSEITHNERVIEYFTKQLLMYIKGVLH